ncbi:hypothetical protein HOE31_00330 [bacterium]|jgi:hypothetical protein|nr:hypothetical protein [bacterium]MBT4121388.1 hypothetical protein [bacterium]MBT4335065.1 hypothetical protein [bacterium]MBT4495599.1 hypothetical protein [bacterium]MBT4764079.1 hypothetical protein [bacterium]
MSEKRDMIDGKWYKLTPPSVIGGKSYSLVCCEYKDLNPKYPNDYIVKGISEGGTELESFILRFGDKGVCVELAEPPTQESN